MIFQITTTQFMPIHLFFLLCLQEERAPLVCSSVLAWQVHQSFEVLLCYYGVLVTSAVVFPSSQLEFSDISVNMFIDACQICVLGIKHTPPRGKSRG